MPSGIMAQHPATTAQNGSKCHCAPLRSPLSAMRWPSEPNGLTASIASSSSSSLKKEQRDRISCSARCFRFLASCDHAQTRPEVQQQSYKTIYEKASGVVQHQVFTERKKKWFCTHRVFEYFPLLINIKLPIHSSIPSPTEDSDIDLWL